MRLVPIVALVSEETARKAEALTAERVAACPPSADLEHHMTSHGWTYEMVMYGAIIDEVIDEVLS
jgi:hypothetical protein